MYYTGTKQECEDYNTKVTLGENYHGSTIDFASVKEHQNGVEFSILKHESYESDMTLINELPSDSYNTAEI